jgi:release factor glutamine methyltransferase
VADKVDIRQSDLFNMFVVDEKFDFIVFNPPYLPIDTRIRSGKWIEKAWCGGLNGRKIIDRFLNSVERYVTENGRILMVQSSLSNYEVSLERFRELGFRVEVLVAKELFFEKIVVIHAKKGNAGTLFEEVA